MYKLLVTAFDSLARLANGVSDVFSDGRKLARLLTVVGLLFAGGALTGTFALEGPESTDEDTAGRLLWLPGNVTAVESSGGDVLATIESGESLRFRFPAEFYLAPDEETLTLHSVDGDVAWDPRERGDGMAVLTRGPQTAGTTLTMVLDDELASQEPNLALADLPRADLEQLDGAELFSDALGEADLEGTRERGMLLGVDAVHDQIEVFDL